VPLRVTNKHAGRAATPRRPHAARPLNTLYMTPTVVSLFAGGRRDVQAGAHLQ